MEPHRNPVRRGGAQLAPCKTCFNLHCAELPSPCRDTTFRKWTSLTESFTMVPTRRSAGGSGSVTPRASNMQPETMRPFLAQVQLFTEDASFATGGAQHPNDNRWPQPPASSGSGASSIISLASPCSSCSPASMGSACMSLPGTASHLSNDGSMFVCRPEMAGEDMTLYEGAGTSDQIGSCHSQWWTKQIPEYGSQDLLRMKLALRSGRELSKPPIPRRHARQAELTLQDGVPR